ncbi:hypothetical protein EDD11_000138 [Mortierella claussenii]|nr:hypothetical protein EDD11_000138 [Mortierella claussenii]
MHFKSGFFTNVPRTLLLCTVLLQIQFNLLVESRQSGPRRLPPDKLVETEIDTTTVPTNTVNSKGTLGKTDYCAIAANASTTAQGVIPYSTAKGCYEMFVFNPKIRDKTIKSVKANLESFYVFYDIVKSPPHMENSDLGPVDLTKELTQLGEQIYPNDYTFHDKLANTMAQMQDPHTTYRSMCYQQFMFVQPISTYGVYEDGRQQVKVATVLNKLDPRLSTELVDCEVTHIDGRPAFDVISEFAKTKSYSKDRGVRINKSFSYLAHDETGGPYDRYALGAFAQRTNIPSNATIKYKIDCRAKFGDDELMEHPVSSLSTIELAWSALDATTKPYYDAGSYHQQFCSEDSAQTVKKFVLDSASADDFSAVRTKALRGRKKARELHRSAYASFHLLSDGVTGVFRLATESSNKHQGNHPSFYANIDKGFAELERAGATRLIVDLQSNSGGIICWGRYVLQTLFPSTVNSPYIYRLRASPLAQALARATFRYKQTVDSPYEGLVDPKTGDEVMTDAWMTPGSALPGRDGLFSSEVTDRFCPEVEDVRDGRGDALFAPEEMVLLTNGYCGSTCAVLALQLHERYGVRTVAIGGEHGQSMAFTSFPGGAVQANNTLWVDRIHKVYNTLPAAARTKELESLLSKRLPANGQLAFTFRQVMSASHSDQVSEYLRIPSKIRMDYTVARFRMPSILWQDVRDQVWGVPTLSAKTKADEAEEENGRTVENNKEEAETFESEGSETVFFGNPLPGSMVEAGETAVEDVLEAETLEGPGQEPNRAMYKRKGVARYY